MSFYVRFLLLLSLLFVVYCSVGIYQIKKAHPIRVIYAATYSEWNYFDSKILPFPFRRYFSEREFNNTSLSELENTPAFEMTLYTVLGVKEFGEVVSEKEQARLERLADGLLKKGMSLESKTSKGCDALKMAIINEDAQGVHYLVSRGFELNDENGQSTLGENDKNPCQKSTQYLLDKYLPAYNNNPS